MFTAGTASRGGIAKDKKPKFFLHNDLYHLGWDAYLGAFRDCQHAKAIGDGSTSYSQIRYYPRVVDRIKQHVPDTKIIYMVRHPLKRMESGYMEHLCTRYGVLYRSFDDAVRRQAMIVNGSRYWEVFDAYRQQFDESKIKIVWFEEYIADRTAVFQDVCRFLEISDTFVPDLTLENTNSGRDKVAQRLAQAGRSDFVVETNWVPRTRQWVINEIREDILTFLAHFNRPPDYWGDLS